MRSKLLSLWNRLRSSYWFVPSVMAASVAVLALVTIEIDQRWGAELPVPWIALGPSSARAFLTTVAGSMITVAGVVFSITMVVLTLASSQFGPRLLSNFMRDRGNQVVLGTFIATFLYCLLVLRVLELGPEGMEAGEVVPEISLATALLLTLGSLAVFIYFIHHVATSIQVSSLTAQLGRDLDRVLAALRDEPDDDGGPGWGDEDAELRRRLAEEGEEVAAVESGYVDAVDADRLASLCEEHGLVALVVQKPGRFVVAGAPLLQVMGSPAEDGGEPGGGAAGHLDDEVRERLRRACPLTLKRRPGDLEFVLAQLAELAVRALSPGINDPFTAINCIDVLGASLASFAEEPPPPPRRRDGAGTLRVILPSLTLKDVLGTAFHMIRQYGRDSAAVVLRLQERLADLAARASSRDDLRAVLHHAAMVRRGALEALPEAADRDDVEERHRWVLEAAGEDPDDLPSEATLEGKKGSGEGAEGQIG